MAYHLSIVFGVDAGTTYAVEDGQRCAVGRGESSNIQLDDEAVAWEHAIFTVEDNRMFVENLSALGTKVNGRLLTEKTRLSPGDRVEFAPNAVLSVSTDQGSGQGSGGGLMVVLALLLVVILGAGIAATVLWNTVFKERFQPQQVAITNDNWQTVYDRLIIKLDQWVEQDKTTAELPARLETAWRFENLGDRRAAHTAYQEIMTNLMVLPEPVAGKVSFAAAASPKGRELAVYLGRDPAEDPAQMPWAGDGMHASALVWFVRTRHNATKPSNEKTKAFGL
jgi:pSer/pThr/pTyr-binding forkhead associated (FHA) protein